MDMKSLSGCRVLLTGASGFIGSHVVDALLDAGASVRGFLHYNGQNGTGLLDPISLHHVRFEIFPGDLLDDGAVDKAVQGMDVVIHAGAIISIPFSYENPGLTTQVNVMGTLHVLQACLRHKVKRVVVTSTSEVYGSAEPLPITESHPLKPQSPYAASKIGADALARSFYCSYGLPVVILRPFNTFGPRQSDRAVIPTIICQALSNKDKIEVGTLTTKRDFVFVKDTAQAFVAAAAAGVDVNGDTIHFGTGKSYAVADVVTHVKYILNSGKPVTSAPGRVRPNQSEVTHLLADPTKAKALLGWEAKTSFEDGLNQTISYIKRFPEKYSPDRYVK